MVFTIESMNIFSPNIWALFAEIENLVNNEEVENFAKSDLKSCISYVYGIYRTVQSKKPTDSYGTNLTENVCEERIKQIIDFTWEKLNTGCWKDVHISWRYTYSYASIIKVFLLCVHGKLKEAVSTCDMGLLMGAPVSNNLLSKLASHISSYIEVEKLNCPPLKKLRVTPVEVIIENPLNRISRPSLSAFNNLMLNKQPIIITNMTEHWPAMHKWNLDYLLSVAGKRMVPVEIGSHYTEESWSQKLMTLKEFIEEYIYNTNESGYLAQHELFNQIPELKNDIVIPDYCCLHTSNTCDSDLEEENIEINAWFGPQGTVSPMHHDPKHNLLAQVMGQKYIRLYDEKYSDLVYPYESKLLSNTSQVDVEKPDLEKFPKFLNAPYAECVLKPGEILYIPPKCWHYVRSMSLSFSVSFWWQ